MPVRWVEWSDEAEAAFEAYLDWIAERNLQAAEEIRVEIEDWTRLLAAHPGIGNPNRWPGFLVHGDKDRNKLIIYEVFDDRIEIAAFRDMRQDNSKLRLRPKSK
ncbi:type II toxin-antitoxin system RelE/ParE family toxin [uncultured Brevundimonas sp.]|uniref:type II toxin-antitoxin system RelE/ParE family toxin n=1 Tax=uncultured Brevundimonas sp. TaxID=213418 RepID=UPI00260C7D4B|nr:type II toxin-antitoxin system RelE/ParE family toxin [uncultured Brevundimonas sp.]